MQSLATRQPGPALLVLVLIYSRGKLLLLRRGCEPYLGKWAPPGGFVEHGESVEAAAVREVWEETQLQLDTTQMLPKGVMSVTQLNQVHHVFVVYLPEPAAVAPVPPESLDVRWFSEADCVRADAEFWEPGTHVDYTTLFRILGGGRCDLFQWNEDYQRIITADGQVRYVWRRAPSKY